MIYHAHCKHCKTRWRVEPPTGLPMDLTAAIGIMEKGLCPGCGNDGSKGPVAWRFRFGPDCGPTTAEVRHKEP